jgi:hypothetical protein
MNGTNHNGSHEDLTSIGRPGTPSSFLSGKPEPIKKKSGGWFSRLAGGARRTSVVYESSNTASQQREKKPPGPPPPKLPELNQLKAKISYDEEGSLGGGDMFRDIRGE